MNRINADKVIYTFEPTMEPAIKINPGEEIIVETNDCFFQQINSEDQVLMEIDFDMINPATGPIYIEGAEVGDLLKVEIQKIIVKNKGVAAVVPGEGVLGDMANKPIVKVFPIQDGYAMFKDLKLPISPMIGVIGVAPSELEGPCPTQTPWKHGGNMDTTDIKEGSTLFFQVNQKGGLLALGDCHAMMGDGEICFTGLEIPAEVTLKVDVIKQKAINWPLLKTTSHTMIVASGETIEDSIYSGTKEAVRILSKVLNLSFEEAYLLTSISVDIKVSQVVDPKKTIRASIPNWLIGTEDLIGRL